MDHSQVSLVRFIVTHVAGEPLDPPFQMMKKRDGIWGAYDLDIDGGRFRRGGYSDKDVADQIRETWSIFVLDPVPAFVLDLS